MKFLCKLYGHKMYSITWAANSDDFTVLCVRCEKSWTKNTRLGSHNE